MKKLPATLALALLPAALGAGAVSPQEDGAAPASESTPPATPQSVTASPLQPADTISPQATLRSFLDAMNGSYGLIMDAHRLNTVDRDRAAPGEVANKAREAKELLERAVSCLDLSGVPIAYRRDAGYEMALQLKEIFDRIELPQLASIPDAVDVEREKEEERSWELVKWRVPGTSIAIAEIQEGSRQGEFLFTADTVSRLARDYARVEQLPYKISAPTSEGFFEFYIGTPGRLLPPRWSEGLPEWTIHRFYQQTIWQWAVLVVALILAASMVVLSYSVLLRRARGLSETKLMWRRVLFCLTPLVALEALRYLGAIINITGPVLVAVRTALAPLGWFFTAAAVSFVSRAVAENIVASPKIDPEGIQASYIRAVFSVSGILVSGTIVIYGLARVGIAVVPLLAGVGIGGFALALAARPTLESIIGSFTIFVDNPYRVGQRVQVMGHVGTVESIGLRSTRIRLSNGHVTTIPNEKMAAVDIENIALRPYIRRTFDITVTYDTSPEMIRRAVEILREILSVPANSDGQHPNEAVNQPDRPPRIYFNDLNPDSLNIYVSYWYHPGDHWSYMEHAHDVNLQIMERFNSEGIEFAFPTQTLHLAGEADRPAEAE